MIEIPVHDMDGQQVGSFEVDEQTLGGEVRPTLLKQAYVRMHANRRSGSAHTRNRSEVSGSTSKMYRQKGSGNARRGPRGTNIMKGGGHGHSKKPHSWRLDMPRKMRRLANRNALLAKAVDGEIKIVESLDFETPSTKQMVRLLESLKIDRTCLLALADTRSPSARSAANVASVHLTRVDRLNAFDVLNHRYLLVERQALADLIAGGGAENKEAQ
ncbi:MAG: 50S ribosomal protein L4 [Phycisphaeraceae bacterium]|nr:50S ribosomal protein L4 [Phycisphaeraceae bacterium]